MAKKTFCLGTAIKITTVLSVNTATSVTINIEDSAETLKVTAGTMTKEADKVYSYIYQSASTDQEGDYILTITATYGGYSSVVQEYVTLIEQD